jgi:hypothetical protein
MTPSPDTAPHAHAAETVALRYKSNCLHLPKLCRGAACRRARQCKGDPRTCVSRYELLVPEEARDWMRISLEGLRADRDFDELRAEHPDEFEAFIYWHEVMEWAYRR